MREAPAEQRVRPERPRRILHGRNGRRAPVRPSRSAAEQQAGEEHGGPDHMIGESMRKKIVSVIVLATKRPRRQARPQRGRETTSITVAIFGANHMVSVMANSAMPASGRMNSPRAGNATASRPSTSSPSRRGSEEHQHRERDLVAADRLEPRHHQERPVLHVALRPAQVAADEFQERRRVLLQLAPSSGSTRTS